MSVNKVILVGHLGADPELRYTPSGAANARLRLATNRRFKDRDGNLVDDTQWHNIKVWGATAENCEKYLSKGRQIFVEGRLEHREYEKDGVKRWWTEVVAHSVQFLGERGNGTHASTGAQPDESQQQYSDADIPF